MPIHYNSPDHVKERASVEALTVAQSKEAVELINSLLYDADRYGQLVVTKEETALLQRLIWRYENFEHLEASTKELLNEYIERHNLKFEIEQLKLTKQSYVLAIEHLKQQLPHVEKWNAIHNPPKTK